MSVWMQASFAGVVMTDAAMGGAYAVVVGDSIAEGHPARHSRLHSEGKRFDRGHKSLPGQINYELYCWLGLPAVNQGIGGNTTQQVRDRWSRDVIWSVNKKMTFELPRRPSLIYLHAGINDVFLGRPPTETKENFRYFARSSVAHGIALVVANIGPSTTYSDEQIEIAKQINAWLEGEFTSEFPGVMVVDYLGWATAGTYDYRRLAAGRFADHVHPNKSGYSGYSMVIKEAIQGRVQNYPAILANMIQSQPRKFSFLPACE